jgi:hypothetical protein
MFIHHVYFWLKNGLDYQSMTNKADRRIKKAFERIHHLQKFLHRCAPATNRDVIERSYSCFLASFF